MYMNKKIIAAGLALSTIGLSAASVQAKKITSSAQAEKLATKYVKGATVLFTEEEGNWDTFLATGIIMPYLPQAAILPLVLFHFFREEIFN